MSKVSVIGIDLAKKEDETKRSDQLPGTLLSTVAFKVESSDEGRKRGYTIRALPARHDAGYTFASNHYCLKPLLLTSGRGHIRSLNHCAKIPKMCSSLSGNDSTNDGWLSQTYLQAVDKPKTRQPKPFLVLTERVLSSYLELKKCTTGVSPSLQ